MKIGIVSPYYIDRFGGVQSHILATRNELIKRGHEVKILAPKPRKAGDSKNEAHVVTLGVSAELKFASLKTTFPVAMSVTPKEIEAILTEESFDVLHVHEPYMMGLAYQIVSRATCPVVGTLHASWPESFKSKSLGRAMRGYFKAAASKVDLLTAVSSEAGAFARKGVNKKVTIVPNGIELSEYQKRETPDSEHKAKMKQTVVYIGRLEKRKGVIYLIKAFEELQKNDDDIELLIAGAGPTARALKSYVKRHKLKHVKFLGFVDENEKKSLLKSADIYCSPALYGESFGIVLLEAMAMGTVIVAGNNPGYSSVMTGRGRLSLIDPLATKDFASRLDLMLHDEEIRKSWLDWAQEYVKQFDYSNITDQYEKLYQQALND